ncbi:unnamed protein product [Lactuca virosa]|uniref:Uncharacterized protein n=1 Tax=Lactuca virosa TaxID=75947 RepID=A0AAU9NJW2_9ASTR|nr:unnamed protein product [Lactuca virosa]
MTQSEPNGLFAMVELNYQWVFTRNPFFYIGDGIIYVYVDHIGVGVDGWFDDEDNDDDGCESCIDGENEDNIVNLGMLSLNLMRM